MNARKAALADNPELILRVLQLRFDESLSYPRISAQTGATLNGTGDFGLLSHEAPATTVRHDSPTASKLTDKSS
ncbi:Mobile element protein [Escherichia coli]|uniref:Mobile element protein n=1 Tax=Escherichia coli TaxID=562 RepID=A0A1W1EM17_ECOLX|nr:Mobile element protein [Escherichia coli]